MNSTLYVVGYCPSCGTGPLGVRICGGCGRPNVLCEECDALWLTVEVSGRPIFARQPDLPCPACETSLLAPEAHWASFFEIEALGWEHHIIDVGRALGSQDS